MFAIASRTFATLTEKASKPVANRVAKAPKTPQELFEQYSARFNKLQTSFTTNQTRISALEAKNPSKLEHVNDNRAALIEKYQQRQEKLAPQMKRANRLVKMQQRKIEKQERQAQLPPADKLKAMPQPQRLQTLAQIDTGLRSAYQLFSKELSLLKPGTPFQGFLDGWKALPETEKAIYQQTIQAAKTAREQAAI